MAGLISFNARIRAVLPQMPLNKAGHFADASIAERSASDCKPVCWHIPLHNIFRCLSPTEVESRAADARMDAHAGTDSAA